MLLLGGLEERDTMHIACLVAILICLAPWVSCRNLVEWKRMLLPSSNFLGRVQEQPAQTHSCCEGCQRQLLANALASNSMLAARAVLAAAADSCVLPSAPSCKPRVTTSVTLNWRSAFTTYAAP